MSGFTWMLIICAILAVLFISDGRRNRRKRGR